MNFPFYIARRYLFSLSKNNAINIITGIASVGIIVGAMALFVVLSVFSGLKNFSLSFSNSFDPDLKITASKGKSIMISPQQQRAMLQVNGVEATSLVLEERVLFMFGGKEHVAYLKGVDSLFGKVNDVSKMLFNGQWLAPNTYQAVVGYGIADKLSVGLFDYTNKLEVFVPKPGKGTIESAEQAFNKSALIPIGIYTISEDFDSKFVFADLGLVQELLQYKTNQVSAVEIRLKPGADEPETIKSLEKIFDQPVSIRTRAQQNESLYRMLNTENLAVYLIFTLVIIIALFNLIGALIMMVLDKKANLKTLVNLGAEVKDLRKIFLLQGTLLSALGGLIGLIIGIAIVLIQQRFQLVMITPSLAYPVVFSFKNIAVVAVTIMLLGFLSSLIASTRVNKTLLD
ncbi:MAG: ABC transporter permease [Flavobacterium sp.]|nr:MAG: ABC transporter permease [Flavobacterium sp.]